MPQAQQHQALQLPENMSVIKLQPKPSLLQSSTLLQPLTAAT
jgi:hypothetical protein